MPERIQLRRTKGWRKPEGVVVVARPSRWGNPYRVGDTVTLPRGRQVVVEDAAEAVRLYRRWLFTQERSRDLVPELGGRDLACWCPLDQPCHADVLLEMAARQPDLLQRLADSFATEQSDERGGPDGNE